MDLDGFIKIISHGRPMKSSVSYSGARAADMIMEEFWHWNIALPPKI